MQATSRPRHQRASQPRHQHATQPRDQWLAAELDRHQDVVHAATGKTTNARINTTTMLTVVNNLSV